MYLTGLESFELVLHQVLHLVADEFAAQCADLMVGHKVGQPNQDGGGVGGQVRVLIEADAGRVGIGNGGLRGYDALAASNRAEQLPDLRHHRVGVEVALHHNSLVLRLIPPLVESADDLGRAVADDVHVADGQALGVDGVVEEFAGELLREGDGVLHAPFLDDDAPLALHVGIGHRGIARPVAQHQQARVHLCGIGRGDAVEQVAHGVATREGVAVVAEGDAVAAHEANDFLAGKMLRASKQNVLHEVRHALLVVLLKDGAGLHHQTEVGLLLRVGATTHVVGEAVLQHARANGGVGGNLLTVDDVQVRHQQRVVLLLGKGDAAQQHGQYDSKQSHTIDLPSR